jgi:steroid 5-alpha reductase family enzyme
VNLVGTIAAPCGLATTRNSGGQRFVDALWLTGLLASAILAALLAAHTCDRNWNFVVLVGLSLVGVGTMGSQTG